MPLGRWPISTVLINLPVMGSTIASALSFSRVTKTVSACAFATNAIDKMAKTAEGATLVAQCDEGRLKSPPQNKPIALLAGGETTVTLKGNGRGGRNQEMALAFAIAAEQQGLTGDWVFLSGGTDGRDGPTDAAGGIVDSNSIKRMTQAGVNPSELLENNDSYAALKTSDDLVITGATGTNVADLQIVLIQPEP